MMQQVSIGLIGAGTVGGGVVHALEQNRAILQSRLGLTLDVARVAVRNVARTRSVSLPPEKITTDWKSVVKDPSVQVVAELIGGTTVARDVVLTALKLGKPVVTANKALVSAHGEELFAAAREYGGNLYYEASVAGGIPIIKLLRESLIGNQFSRLVGIVNGTCNYILSRMEQEGAPFDTVLKDAQDLGYAEAEPSLDIDGHDAAHKTGILASLAHGFWVKPEEVYTEGICGIDALDIQFANRLGYSIKHLGMVRMIPDEVASATSRSKRGRGKQPANGPVIQVAVYPALIPKGHVLASVRDAFNAISVQGNVVGESLYYGRGAGAEATASSVISDLADAALDLKFGSHHRVPPFTAREGHGRVASIDATQSKYYLRLQVMDRPGVFAKIAALLGRAQIGISSIIQPEGHVGATVPVILMLHEAPCAAVTRALTQIGRLKEVCQPPRMIRVETLA